MFNAIPPNDFLNRENELDYLKGLSTLKRNDLGGNVFLAGGRGLGKTELLRQLYRILFWEDDVIPFYYSFKRANHKGSYFARDYFTSFVRQYISFLKKEPSLAGGGGEPLRRLEQIMSAEGLFWLIDYIEDFQEYVNKNDFYWQIRAAVAIPVKTAQMGGKPVLVMLDDFEEADHLYESQLNDVQGLITLFVESMKSRLCPHVITGGAGAGEVIFRNQALAAMIEPLKLFPLPEDQAAGLFRLHLDRLRISAAPGVKFKFLDILKGNPLYIRNLAKAAWKMRKKELREEDLLECYALEVTEGETAFYWSSVLDRCAKSMAQRKAILRILRYIQEKGEPEDRLSLVSQLSDAETKAIMELLKTSGLLDTTDGVVGDFVHCLYLKEIEGHSCHEIKRRLEEKYLSEEDETCFEIVIPMSTNAELVVAKAVEQIGKNINLNDDFLNYLQLALIEVCINASEHSGSYDKRVFLRFVVRADKLEIIAENTGRPFSLEGRKELSTEEKLKKGIKRGWGFKLIYSIMDDVRIERNGDRTRVIMTKNIEEHMLRKDREGAI